MDLLRQRNHEDQNRTRIEQESPRKVPKRAAMPFVKVNRKSQMT
jgi:hypothetical protein